MKIIVTGGAGFIGSHLCERLLKQGHQVVCLDNFFTGTTENIKAFAEDPNFTIYGHDVTVPYDLGPVDQIYNLACPASPIHYSKNPIETVRTNVLGMIHALEVATKYKAKILQTSTSEIYGDPLEHPQAEHHWGNVNPVGPRSCYDEGKRCAESLCYNYSQEYGTDVKIIRVFNTYGPRMQFHDGRALPNFIKQALSHEEITVAGSGLQTRSLMYIDDLIDGLLAMMAMDNFLGPINLGNPHQELTMLELAQKVIELCNSNSKLTFYELPKDDPIKRRPDITRAKEKLNWEPKIHLDEGIKKTIADFKLRLGI